ncbi:hypothetical protein ACH4SP_24070 [Streptomyces sp. NPDC021093]|uniref:hypothetical protein n=1 Tax=Streptomyces sp. NPDC021093 TaxID=3365112 RepID=UPI0037BBFBCA
MNKALVRRAGLSVLTVVALTGLAACNGGNGGKQTEGSKQTDAGKQADGGTDGTDSARSALSVLQAAQKKAGAANSAKIESTMSVGTTMGTESKGAIRWDNGVTGVMDLRYTSGPMAENLRKAGSDGRMKARYLPDAYYVDMGPAFAKDMGGKSWIRYSYDDMVKLMGPSGALLKDQMQNSTPEQGVKQLLASGQVKEVGKEDVRGVQATHYTGTLDVQKMAEANSKLDAKTLAGLKSQLEQTGVTTSTVDIWVDKEDLLVKKTERSESKIGPINSTVFYTDYGVDVAAEAPAADRTLDFKDLMKQQQKQQKQQQG